MQDSICETSFKIRARKMRVGGKLMNHFPWKRMAVALCLALIGSVGISAVSAPQQNAPAATPSPYRFHHVHLNTLNARAAIDFYAKTFNAESAMFGGTIPAVNAQGKWLLFNQVSQA